jgi:hypothetical protein
MSHKQVVVTHGDSATADAMLAKLQTWGTAAGKTVALQE